MRLFSIVLGMGVLGWISAHPFTAGADQADDHFQQGTKLAEAGKAPEAEEAFEKAWSLRKAWDIAANLGLMEAEQGKWTEAAEHLHYAMTHIGSLATEEHKAGLRQRYDNVVARLAKVQVAADPGFASVRVGSRTGASTEPLFLMEGQHELECSAEGYETVTLKVTAMKGESQTLKVELKKVGGGTGPVVPPPEGRPLWPAVLLGVAGGAGLILGGVGFGLAAASSGDADDLAARKQEASCGEDGSACGDVEDSLSSVNTFVGLGVSGAVLGGLSVIGLVVYLAVPGSEEKVSIKPLAGSTVGLLLEGAFQ